MREPTLREIRAALLVSQTGSFRQAARRMDIAPSTLSHLLTGLEEALGVRLFHRTTRSVAPTEEGRALLDRMAPLVEQFAEALNSLGSDVGVVRGRLRISTPYSAVLYLLQAVVPAFVERYPEVELELQHEERLIDIVTAGCDAGIRRRQTVSNDMIGVAFGPALRWIPVAAPDYLARHGVPSHPRDLLDHRCLRIRMPGGDRYQWEFERCDETLAIDAPGSLTLDRMSLMVEAAVRGMGVAYVLDHVAARHVRAGELQALLPDWCTDDGEYMLYYPSRRQLSPALRAFIDLLRDETRSIRG